MVSRYAPSNEVASDACQRSNVMTSSKALERLCPSSGPANRSVRLRRVCRSSPSVCSHRHAVATGRAPEDHRLSGTGTISEAPTMDRSFSPFLAFSSLLVALLVTLNASAQISVATAVDLTLRNNPKVQLAQADVARARAAVQETRDAYIPSLAVGGSGYGKGYGFPLGQPTALTVQSQSLVFSFSQHDYLRSARAGYDAANFSLLEAREVAAEDAILTCIALEHDFARQRALQEQQGFAARLVQIIQERLDVGQDTQIDLTTSRLTDAQIRLRELQVQDDTDVDRAHLAHLMGVPTGSLNNIESGIPPIPSVSPAEAALGAPPSPGVDAAFANARAKREQAFGDSRYLFRPQVNFVGQYSLLSTFANSNYQEYFGRRAPDGTLLPFPAYAIGVGVQVSVPILDYIHRARARESAADAVHAERDAAQLQDQFAEIRLRTQRSTAELAAHAEIAELDQQLARQQLEIVQIQLKSAGAGSAPMSPKDEQNALISERDKYLTVLDTRFQMQQAQISLLRQTGHLEQWLKSIAPGALPAAPALSLAPNP